MSIWEFYKDANILITGGLGFVGKVLIEKLLRSCSNVNSINMLIRPKIGQTVDERMEEFLISPVSLIYNFIYLLSYVSHKDLLSLLSAWSLFLIRYLKIRCKYQGKLEKN